MIYDDVDPDDMTWDEGEIANANAPFPKHVIIVSGSLHHVMDALTPTFQNDFTAYQQAIMEEFCKQALTTSPSRLDFGDLLLDTFQVFYSCLARIMQHAQPGVEQRLMEIYGNRLSINFYHGVERELTVMLDLLPTCVFAFPRIKSRFDLVRTTTEFKLNKLH